MKQQLLLLNDVDSLGRKGDIVFAKPGYIRNFLLPRGLAVIASPHTLRKQETLRLEREKQAVVDRAESEKLAKALEGLVLEIRVKVDPEGHMYGSVTPIDIARLFEEKGFAIDRKFIQINRAIKETGMHKVPLKLREGILVTCQLSIIPEGLVMTGVEAVTAPLGEVAAEETSSE